MQSFLDKRNYGAVMRETGHATEYLEQGDGCPMFPGYQIQFELEYSCLMTGYQQIGAESIIEIRAPTVGHELNAMALHKTHFDAEDRSDPSGLTICYEFSFEGLAFRNGSRHQVAAEPVC